MKINVEGSTRITLKNDNFRDYITGGVFVLVALYFAYSWKLFNFLNKDFSWGADIPFIAFTLIFLAVGLWIIVTSKKMLVILDKEQQMGSVSSRNILNSKVETFKLNEVSEIELKVNTEIQEYHGKKSRAIRTRKYYHYIMEMKLKNDKTIQTEVDKIQAGSFSDYEQEYEKRANEIRKIAEFLEVPLIENKQKPKNQNMFDEEITT